MKAKTAVPSRNFEQKLLRSERSPSSIYNAAVSAFLFAQSEDWWTNLYFDREFESCSLHHSFQTPSLFLTVNKPSETQTDEMP